jgi:tetratricopeptide (TPR) repeat protein
VATTVGTVAVESRAAGNDETMAAGLQRFDQGRRAYEAGQFEQALLAFQGSYELFASPNTRYYVGRCYRALGKVASAYTAFKLAAREAQDRLTASGEKRYMATRDAAAHEAAARDLDDERSRLYADLVLASVDEAARAILEALMASGNYEYQSDFARRYVAQGKAEGIAEGKAEGIAEGKAEGIAEGKAEGIAEGKAAGRAEGGAHAIFAVLAARGLDVPDEVRARITACTELARLDACLARAVTASSAAEVIDE